VIEKKKRKWRQNSENPPHASLEHSHLVNSGFLEATIGALWRIIFKGRFFLFLFFSAGEGSNLVWGLKGVSFVMLL